MRRMVLQYAMVPTHRASFRASFRGSFPALDETAAAWQLGDRRAALRLVSYDIVHALCVIGDPGADGGLHAGPAGRGRNLASRADPGRRARRRHRSTSHDHRPAPVPRSIATPGFAPS
jgi:hypothetical protein